MPMTNKYFKNLKEILPEGVYFQSEKRKLPSKKTLDNIFNYSKSLKIEKSESIGNVEVILN